MRGGGERKGTLVVDEVDKGTLSAGLSSRILDELRHGNHRIRHRNGEL